LSKTKFDSMPFYEGGDGSLTDIVAAKSLFKSKEDFLYWFLNDSEEYGDFLNGYLENEEKPFFTIDDVQEGYVRYYPHFGEDSGANIESGYMFCNKGRGAFEVYSISFQ